MNSKTPILDQIMAEYDAASDDVEWSGDHPILKMAAEIDSLNAKCSAYAGFMHEALMMIPDSGKGSDLYRRIEAAIKSGSLSTHHN